MNNIHTSRSLAMVALPPAILTVLLSAFIARPSFAAGTPAPAATPIITGSAGATASDEPAPVIPGSADGVQITDPNVIARIGDVDVTMDDMRATIASLDPDQKAAAAADPAMLEKIVRTLLMERVVLKEITSKQWDQQPDVKAHLDKMRVTAVTDMYLQSVTTPPDGFPSDTELHEAYETHKAAFAVPHQFLFSQVFVAEPINAGKDADEKAKTRLDAIIKEIKEPGADFASIARNESDDKLSAQQGGEMGWMGEDKLAPRIRALSHVLGKDSVSGPVRLADGWHILKLLDTRDFSPASFDDVKVRLAQVMRVERERTDRLAYINKLLDEYPVTINDAAMPNLLNKPKK